MCRTSLARTGLVPDEQVVVDLHDDQAAGRERHAGPRGDGVQPVPGRPGREPRRVRDLGERGARQGRLAEAGPALADVVGQLACLARAGRHQEEDGVVDLGAAVSGKNWLETMIESVVTCGSTRVQW